MLSARHTAAWRSRNRAPAGWVAWATNAITEGRARFRIGTQWFSRSGCWSRRAGAALRSWQAGAVQFTAKICGLVGRAAMADPLSAGGAFSSLSARCFFSGAVGCPLSSGQSIRVPSCDPASQANVVAVVRGEARRFAGSCRFRGYQGPIPEPIQSVRPHVGKVLLPGCSGDRGKRRSDLNFPTLRVAWCPWARQNRSGRRISWAGARVGIDR